MPRATNNPASRHRRKAVLKRAKGFVGGRSRLFRTATETVNRAMRYATRDRRMRKREFRNLWVVRINAACRLCDISYSKLISGLKAAHVALNRQMLSELANKDFETFKAIVTLVRSHAA